MRVIQTIEEKINLGLYKEAFFLLADNWNTIPKKVYGDFMEKIVLWAEENDEVFYEKLYQLSLKFQAKLN